MLLKVREVDPHYSTLFWPGPFHPTSREEGSLSGVNEMLRRSSSTRQHCLLGEDDLPKEELEESPKPSNQRGIPTHLRGVVWQVSEALARVAPLTFTAVAMRCTIATIVNEGAA